jgi:hypothetical protein
MLQGRHEWWAWAESEPGPEGVDPLVAAPDAAGESVRHAGA